MVRAGRLRQQKTYLEGVRIRDQLEVPLEVGRDQLRIEIKTGTQGFRVVEDRRHGRGNGAIAGFGLGRSRGTRKFGDGRLVLRTCAVRRGC